MTILTSLTSSPRAATSVATMMGARPLLKSASTRSRSRCSLSPWMAFCGRARSAWFRRGVWAQAGRVGSS
eukprot:3183250-Prymnesium_polylepis.1